jgi:hypothetical protein
MIIVRERALLKGQRQSHEMAAFVQRAARERRPIDEVQRGLWESLSALGRTMLESGRMAEGELHPS